MSIGHTSDRRQQGMLGQRQTDRTLCRLELEISFGISRSLELQQPFAEIILREPLTLKHPPRRLLRSRWLLSRPVFRAFALHPAIIRRNRSSVAITAAGNGSQGQESGCALRLASEGLAVTGALGLSSQRKSAIARSAPTISVRMNHGESTGQIPEKVLVMLRAMATAGLAKQVDAVNQ